MEITAKCAEFSAMVGDTYGRLSRTLGRVILGTERGRVIPIKMEFSKEFLNISTDGHEWAHYYVTKTTISMTKSSKECALCMNDKTRTEVERTVAPESLYKYIVYCNSTIGMRKRLFVRSLWRP